MKKNQLKAASGVRRGGVYEAPQIEMIAIEVEQGFAASDNESPDWEDTDPF